MGTSYVSIRGASVPYNITTCYSCGTPIALTVELHEALLENKKTFYCALGHTQVFTGKSLREQLDAANELLEAEKKKREWAEQSARVEKKRADRAVAEKKRIRKRVKNGVCPDCNRTFANLQRHMATKHGAAAADHKHEGEG